MGSRLKSAPSRRRSSSLKPDENSIAAKLTAEKGSFLDIPPARIEAAKVGGKFNVLTFCALWKDEYPVHYEMALCVCGVALNEAKVERVCSFSSRTLDERADLRHLAP